MTQDKRSLLLQFLERGTVMIHLDARRLGVVVPERFRGHAHLRLNLDYAFRIPDFDLGEEEIVATLSFSQKPYRCVIPWSAIWGITSDPDRRNVLFPDSIPPEIANLLAETSPSTKAPAPSGPKAPTPLRVVASSVAPEAHEEPAPELTDETEPEAEAETEPVATRRGLPPSAMPTPVQNPAPEPPEPETHEESEPPEPSPSPRRGHLRLIKS